MKKYNKSAKRLHNIFFRYLLLFLIEIFIIVYPVINYLKYLNVSADVINKLVILRKVYFVSLILILLLSLYIPAMKGRVAYSNVEQDPFLQDFPLGKVFLFAFLYSLTFCVEFPIATIIVGRIINPWPIFSKFRLVLSIMAIFSAISTIVLTVVIILNFRLAWYIAKKKREKQLSKE